MLIELHESVAGVPPAPWVRDALEALGRADALGYHRVVALPGVTGQIVGRHRPAGLAGEAYARVAGDEVGWLPLRDVLPVSYRVEAGLERAAWDAPAGRGVLRVPLAHCARAGFDRPSVLVGENFGDTRLYVAMGRAFVAARRLVGLRVRVEEVLGGGATTPDVYAEHQARPAPCLAVVDGDRRFPGGPLGDVARAVRERDDADAPHVSWLALDVRAAENALPHPLLRVVAEGDARVASALQQHEAIRASAVAELLDCCDLRGGTPYFEAFRPHADDRRRAYWERVLPAARAAGLVPEPHSGCGPTCRAGVRDGCRCPMVEGYGAVLGRAVAALRVRSAHKVAELVDDRTRPTWEAVGSHVAAWGAARDPLRS